MCGDCDNDKKRAGSLAEVCDLGDSEVDNVRQKESIGSGIS